MFDAMFVSDKSLQDCADSHSIERPHKCRQCEKSYENNEGSKKHMRVHTGERPYKCKLCSESFKWSYSFKTHMRAHDGKVLQCQLCPKFYSNKAGLTVHMKIAHSGNIL